MKEKLYRPGEVAEILKVSRRKVYYLVKHGILESCEGTEHIKIYRKSLYEYQKTLNIEQVKKILRVSRSFIYVLIQRHEFELFKIDGKPLKPYRIIEKSVYDHIARHSYGRAL